jgi:hypothetical protein
VAERTWFVGGWSDRPPTGFAVTEVTVAEPALELTEADVTAIGTAFLARLQREGDVRPRASVLS